MTPPLYRSTWEADEPGIAYIGRPSFADTPAPSVELHAVTPRPRQPFNWRKLDTRMTWLTGGFILFAACQLVYWVAAAVLSGAFARAVAR